MCTLKHLFNELFTAPLNACFDKGLLYSLKDFLADLELFIMIINCISYQDLYIV